MAEELGEVYKVSILPCMPSTAAMTSNRMAITESNIRLNKSQFDTHFYILFLVLLTFFYLQIAAEKSTVKTSCTILGREKYMVTLSQKIKLIVEEIMSFV